MIVGNLLVEFIHSCSEISIKRFLFLLPGLLLVFTVSLLKADIILVPSQQPTIQAGIDAAVDGDTVLVADGTYTGDGNRDIDFLGKAIVVTSENGPENCVIDCGSAGRGFYFHNSEDITSVIQGFTIQNGWAYNGGGIYCTGSSPLITGNTIEGSTADVNGGGIGCYNSSSPEITNNLLIENTAETFGGGIHINQESSPILNDNIIFLNTAANGGGISITYSSTPIIEGNTILVNRGDHGAGIHCTEGSSGTISNNTISGNVATFSGGGIFCSGASPTIIDNTIDVNVAHDGGGIILAGSAVVTGNVIVDNMVIDRGGGIRVGSGIIRDNFISGNNAYRGGGISGYGNPVIENNTISNNDAELGGGLLAEGSGNLTISNNWISENTAIEGGGFYGSKSNASLIYNTIVKNSAISKGGGIRFIDDSFPFLSNNTLYGNVADEGGGVRCTDSCHPLIINCIFWGDSPEELLGANMDVRYSDIQGGRIGEGNIDDNPLFVNPSNDDYHLRAHSPCIDTGDPSSPQDPDGTRADMGAYFVDQGPFRFTINPDTTHYHQGDILGFTIHVSNISDTTVYFQFWTQGETPWGLLLSPLLGPINVILGPHYAMSPHVSQQIPNNTPNGGPYIYSAFVGIYPDSVYVEDSFEFFVVPPDPQKVEQRYGDWEVIEGGQW